MTEENNGDGAHAPWVFVSHASEDLERVRLVRNHLESQGAAPLLFHLVSLKEPEAFWPLICMEIAERNFFLYCDSASARRSKWVRDELGEVARVAQERDIRRATIRVDGETLDLASLAGFIRSQRVFPVYAHADRERVEPYLQAMRLAGFQVFDNLSDYPSMDDWDLRVSPWLAEAARTGWIVLMLSDDFWYSEFCRQEMMRAVAGTDDPGAGRLLVVELGPSWEFVGPDLSRILQQFHRLHVNPDDLVRHMLREEW